MSETKTTHQLGYLLGKQSPLKGKDKIKIAMQVANGKIGLTKSDYGNHKTKESHS